MGNTIQKFKNAVLPYATNACIGAGIGGTLGFSYESAVVPLQAKLDPDRFPSWVPEFPKKLSLRDGLIFGCFYALAQTAANKIFQNKKTQKFPNSKLSTAIRYATYAAGAGAAYGITYLSRLVLNPTPEFSKEELVATTILALATTVLLGTKAKKHVVKNVRAKAENLRSAARESISNMLVPERREKIRREKIEQAEDKRKAAQQKVLDDIDQEKSLTETAEQELAKNAPEKLVKGFEFKAQVTTKAHFDAASLRQSKIANEKKLDDYLKKKKESEAIILKEEDKRDFFKKAIEGLKETIKKQEDMLSHVVVDKNEKKKKHKGSLVYLDDSGKPSGSILDKPNISPSGKQGQ